ncbi:MAG: efflux RND transporter periplasmic adaptor subunit [Thermodesulfobacteriota bacterium]|nr:efflux RND transporter periplasmic adaptor subunit [Thermodesulfobacteriota bacterium]
MKRKRLLHIVVTLALVVLGVLGMFALSLSKPQIRKQKQAVPVPMVRTIKVKTGPQSVHISGEGTVRPLQKIDLVPQVSGKVVYVSPALVNGGSFRKGETLLRIDPVDYRLAVTLAKAKVKNSESLLQLAEEEAAAASQEWCLYHAKGPEPDNKPPPLVVKEPQLEAAKARLEADRADLGIAMLNLERTELKAPFEGRVGEENVDSGQYVPVGKALAGIYSTGAAEIVVPLEDEKAFWFHIPGFTPGKGPGSPATVMARFAGQERTWPAQVVRTEGKLDERTRMINVVVRVEKPYAQKPPLAVGLFVTVDIEGRVLPKVAIIPRSVLHRGDTVWIVDKDDRIRFRKVDVALLQGDEAIVRDGIEDGERLVITPLRAVTDGMAVRTEI